MLLPCTSMGFKIIGTMLGADTVSITFEVAIINPVPAGVTSLGNQGSVPSNELPDEPTDDPDTTTDDDPTLWIGWGITFE